MQKIKPPRQCLARRSPLAHRGDTIAFAPAGTLHAHYGGARPRPLGRDAPACEPVGSEPLANQ